MLLGCEVIYVDQNRLVDMKNSVFPSLRNITGLRWWKGGSAELK